MINFLFIHICLNEYEHAVIEILVLGFRNLGLELGLVRYTCNPSIQEVEAEGLL